MIQIPFRVAIDTREQLPYRFENLKADANRRYKPLLVPTVIETLQSGDYSIEGLENQVAIERKSKDDLFGTLGRGRDRFEAELERLAGYQFASVVVEAEWSSIFEPHEYSELNPKTIFRSVLAWQQRYPVIHWNFLPNREYAEAATFRILERFWKEVQEAN